MSSRERERDSVRTVEHVLEEERDDLCDVDREVVGHGRFIDCYLCVLGGICAAAAALTD